MSELNQDVFQLHKTGQKIDEILTKADNLANIKSLEENQFNLDENGKLALKEEYALKSELNEKEDKIADLSEIREGAAKGATALQEHQSLAEYRKAADQDTIDAAKADKENLENEITRAENAEEALQLGVNGLEARVQTIEGKEAGWDAKQDKLTVDTRDDYKGIALNNGVIGIDHEIIATNEYVDANITDTMNFIIQERDNEHAGRVAGDELLQQNIDKKQDKLTAGENINIDANNKISAVDTKPVLVNQLIAGYTIGGITEGDVFAAGTSIEDVLAQLFYKESPEEGPELYIGFTPNLTYKQFTNLTPAQLLEYVVVEKAASDTPYNYTTVQGDGANSKVYYIMVRDDCDVVGGKLVSGGITTNFPPEDIKGTAAGTAWRAQHADISVGNHSYSIYGYRTPFNANDTMEITIEKIG